MILLALQDAQEYFGHLLEVMAQAEAAAGGRLPSANAPPPTASLFKFGTEDRIQCSETGKVSGGSAGRCGGARGKEGEREVEGRGQRVGLTRSTLHLPTHPSSPACLPACPPACLCVPVAYKPEESTCLGLYIPLEAAENREEVEQYQERQLKRKADMAASSGGQKAPGQVSGAAHCGVMLCVWCLLCLLPARCPSASQPGPAPLLLKIAAAAVLPADGTAARCCLLPATLLPVAAG